MVESDARLEEQNSGNAVSAQRPNSHGHSVQGHNAEEQQRPNQGDTNEGETVRRSSRIKNMPKYLNDYVIDEEQDQGQ